MSRDGGTSANLRPPGLRRAIRAALLPIAAAWPACVAAQAGATPSPATILSLPPLPTFALLGAVLVLLAGIAWRGWRVRRVLTRELREARARSACIEPLLDAWLWQSDAGHRLVAIRPPHGAAAGDWPGASSAPLWERFTAAQPDALRAMLASAAAIDDLAVHLANTSADTSAAPRHGRLRARAHTDDTGRFAGYHGTFRELAPVAVALATTPLPEPVTPAAPTPASDHESFSFTVSHDLRAPIRVVEGFTRIVKEDYGRLLDRVGNDHLDRVLGAAARMNNMIDALLSLSKLSSEPLAHQPVNLSQLAGYVADDLRRQWPDRNVTLAIDPGMQVQGDPTLLRVVIENLLGNAWKYTGKAAQADIGFGRHPQDADTFTVHDNGAGFDMRFSDRLFGVFQRLHSANDFPGTGIGLASVRRIVRRHGGEIWGEAEVNRGARFHFSLPQRSAAR
ncbi:MAG: ATP-binding protein [Pseudomonadota bacterium]